MIKQHLPPDSDWRSCQFLERMFVGLLVGYLPVVLMVDLSIGWLFNSEAPAMFVAIAWMIAFAISSVALYRFDCPRCKKYFFHTWLLNNPLARKCVHCSLPKWSEHKHG